MSTESSFLRLATLWAAMALFFLGCSVPKQDYIVNARVYPERGYAIFATTQGESFCVSTSTGEALWAWKTKEPFNGMWLIREIRPVTGGYWYHDMRRLYQMDEAGKLQRVVRFDGVVQYAEAGYEPIRVMDANDEGVGIGTYHCSVYWYEPKCDKVSLIVKGVKEESIGVWELVLLPGYKAVTSKWGLGADEHTKWVEPARGLMYYGSEMYQSNICLWDLKTAARLWRADVDAHVEMGGAPFIQVDHGRIIHASAQSDWGYAAYDVARKTIVAKSTHVSQNLYFGPPLFNQGRFLSGDPGNGCKRLLFGSYDDHAEELAASADIIPPMSWPGRRLQGMVQDDNRGICLAYDNVGGVYGLRVDWQKCTVEKLWETSPSSWRRKAKLWPHEGKGTVLPKEEVPPVVDVEAAVRPPAPKEYTPGEPFPAVWENPDRKSDVDFMRGMVLEYRSREYAIEWAKANDPKLYEKLVSEGQAGWEARKRKYAQVDENFLKMINGK